MGRRLIVTCALATALVPFGVIVWSHTSWWPEFFAARTDTFVPGGPTLIFSDFVPSQRTSVVHDSARPITASPVYLLFQPRRHSAQVTVVFTARMEHATSSTPPIATLAQQIAMGYRHGDTVEGNVLQPATCLFVMGGADVQCHATFPLENLTRERTDARRLVFLFPHDGGLVWDVSRVRIFYE